MSAQLSQANLSITSINGNSQKLDGGAMFGNAPKALWQKWAQVDELNRIDLTCRCMLIETEGKKILLETGIGAFFDPKLKDRFGVVESDHVLLANLAAAGVSHEDIDMVVISHLHFDHAGGLLSAYEEGQPLSLLFPNATFVVGQEAWERAQRPHFRDRASFVPKLNKLLEQSGRLKLVNPDDGEVIGPGFRFHQSNGHTPGMLLTEVPLAEGPIVFAADLIPGAPWVHLPITMGYDRYPELLIEEKQKLLTDLLARNGQLFFTHDAHVASGKIVQDDRGKFSVAETQEHLVAQV